MGDLEDKTYFYERLAAAIVLAAGLIGFFVFFENDVPSNLMVIGILIVLAAYTAWSAVSEGVNAAPNKIAGLTLVWSLLLSVVFWAAVFYRNYSEGGFTIMAYSFILSMAWGIAYFRYAK